MAGTVKKGVNLESRSARKRLKKGRQPHYVALVPRRLHLGYQCWKGEEVGRWIARRHCGSHLSPSGKPVADYRHSAIGLADDAVEANGRDVLSYTQASARVLATVDVAISGPMPNLTIRQACDQYLERVRAEGRPADEAASRMRVAILPELGDLVVAELTAARLRQCMDRLAQSPRQTRPIKGKPKYLAKPDNADTQRARRASANRVLALLKAVLNLAHAAGHVENAAAWGKALKRFRNVERARVRFFSTDEASRLINAADADFKPLLRAALETGMRYGEISRLLVADFSADSGTIAIHQSKTGKPRHIVLTPEAVEFFRVHCAGKSSDELMFLKANGQGWGKSDQARSMRRACLNVNVKPAGIHTCRHTYASLAIMNGTPLMVVAQTLGHTNLAMVSAHYGHLAPSYVRDAIIKGAPRYDVTTDQKIVPLR